jgi:hypothetical protein
MTIAEIFVWIAHLAIKLNAHPMNKWLECWEHRLDDHWVIAVNGHAEPKTAHRLTVSPVTVQSFTCYVEFNGWPAGFIDPGGGVICAGSEANEEALITALRVACGQEVAQ